MSRASTATAIRRRLATIAGVVALAPGVAAAKGQGLFEVGGSAAESRRFTLDDLLRGWEGFRDIWLMADIAIVRLLAVQICPIIAHNQNDWNKAQDLEELEITKTFIIYAMVGAVIGLVVAI